MLILTINAGSTSVRLGLFEASAGEIKKRTAERDEVEPARAGEVLARFLAPLRTPVALVVHRVVHAGVRFRATAPFDDEVRAAVERMTFLAPLHNPPALAWAAAAQGKLSDAVHLAAFDSGYFAELPAVAATYALPGALARQHGITRLGFHGFAHQSMWEAWHAIAPHRSGRVITLQLGGGASAAALRKGRPIDTSMGFSPLEGLVMGSRSGDLDPGVVLYLQQAAGLDRDAVFRVLNESSGLRGLSEVSGDLRVLLEAETTAAALALDVYSYRIRKYIGAYWAALGGCDAILLGGAAAERSAPLRARIFRALDGIGITLDEVANQNAAPPARISASDSAVEVWVLGADEERLLAREGARWAEAHPAQR
jgi:acetate kinase